MFIIRRIYDELPPMLELRHFKTLAALAETGNLSKAARRINLSQPAVSHQIRGIEEHYGVEIFERKRDPLRLTPAGELLVELSYDVLKRIESSERDLARISEGQEGQLRIAVECHSCFDWLMPSMDVFREHWPQVELDLVSGFHADPIGLLAEDRADLVIVSHGKKRKGISYHPLFAYEVLGLISKLHPLGRKDYLTAADFKSEVLVTYPIPDDRIDLIREMLAPAKIEPKRRNTELTVAILQLVASGRGIAALPGWTVQPYLDRKYIIGKPIGRKGLHSQLYAATTADAGAHSYMQEFLKIMKRISFDTLEGIQAIE